MKIGIITDYSDPSITQILKLKEFLQKATKVNIGYITNGDMFLVNYFGKNKFNIVNSINLSCTRDEIINNSDVVLNLSRREVQKTLRI